MRAFLTIIILALTGLICLVLHSAVIALILYHSLILSRQLGVL